MEYLDNFDETLFDRHEDLIAPDWSPWVASADERMAFMEDDHTELVFKSSRD